MSTHRARSFADDLLRALERGFARAPAPAVATLHQPPVIARGRKDGEFCAIELADGSIGLTYALLEGLPAALGDRRLAGRIEGMPALDLARRYREADPAARALGLAAVNALSQHLFRRVGYLPEGATDSIGGLAPGPGERIGMVGWFPPLTRRIVDSGATLVVVELDPALAGARDGYTVTLDVRELARCDKVLATTTLMLNDTLDAVLAACAPTARVVLVGPGGGCLPDPLFARGVAGLGGTAIADRDGFVAALRQGAPWSGFARKYWIDAHRYPGIEALLAGEA